MKSLCQTIATVTLGLVAACGSNPPPANGPSEPARAPTPLSAAQQFLALRDTVVCVVDRTTDRGLRDLQAKRAETGGAVVLVDNRIRPIEELHPVNIIAGYAGGESWFTRGQPITVQGRPYLKYAGERKVPLAGLRRLGEFQGIPLFAAPADSVRPQAVYVPVRVGCIFNAYVREDLSRG